VTREIFKHWLKIVMLPRCELFLDRGSMVIMYDRSTQNLEQVRGSTLTNGKRSNQFLNVYVALAVKPPSPQKAIIPLNNPGSAQGGFAACEVTSVTVRASEKVLKIMVVLRVDTGRI
jgi:hypothetical protein